MSSSSADETPLSSRGSYLERPEGSRDPASPYPFPYSVRARSRGLATTWDRLCTQYANNARRCFDFLATNPLGRPIDTDRVPRLKGKLAGLYQYEVGDAARIRYRVYEQEKVVWVTDVSIGHPGDTD